MVGITAYEGLERAGISAGQKVLVQGGAGHRWAGFDIIFDTVGGANMTNSFGAAALNANIASTVGPLEIDLSPAHFKGLSLHIIFMLLPMLSGQGRAKHGEILAKLAEIVDAGAMKPLLDDTAFDLDCVGDAYDRLTSGKAIGKVVIDV
ncbi:zinc-binding dehydrogenase [Loktanella salsilacus]|uniref:zinc-binding dehydrogenase n=1 Tax=Loktanella salsilacus TaxID=195913 RepID=UPI003736ADC1